MPSAGTKKRHGCRACRCACHKTAVYGVAGLASAAAAVVLTARLNSAQPTAGTMYELDAIAATVIGGSSLLGGEGSLTGTLIGALIMGVLRNGLNLLNVSSFLQQVVIGVVIIGAVLVDMGLKRKRIRLRATCWVRPYVLRATCSCHVHVHVRPTC